MQLNYSWIVGNAADILGPSQQPSYQRWPPQSLMWPGCRCPAASREHVASSSLTEAGPQDSTADSGDGEDSQLLEKHSYHLY